MRRAWVNADALKLRQGPVHISVEQPVEASLGLKGLDEPTGVQLIAEGAAPVELKSEGGRVVLPLREAGEWTLRWVD